MAGPFRLTKEQFEPLAVGYGGCIASSMVTMDGLPVRFMYRVGPDNQNDSGWCFLAGVEDAAYTASAANFAVFDVNTIANYDQSILPWLDSPAGSAFEKPPGTDLFVQIRDWVPPED